MSIDVVEKSGKSGKLTVDDFLDPLEMPVFNPGAMEGSAPYIAGAKHQEKLGYPR